MIIKSDNVVECEFVFGYTCSHCATSLVLNTEKLRISKTKIIKKDGVYSGLGWKYTCDNLNCVEEKVIAEAEMIEICKRHNILYSDMLEHKTGIKYKRSLFSSVFGL